MVSAVFAAVRTNLSSSGTSALPEFEQGAPLCHPCLSIVLQAVDSHPECGGTQHHCKLCKRILVHICGVCTKLN